MTTLREITLLRELQSEGKQHGIVGLKDVAVSSRFVNLVFPLFFFVALLFLICAVLYARCGLSN